MATFKFSTSGFRGKIGEELNPGMALQIGQAISHYLPENSVIICGRDNRRTSPALLLALMSGLASFRPHRVLFSMEPVPTAAVVRYAKQHRIRFSLVVTGSHLPREDNGIIFFEEFDSYFSGVLEAPGRDEGCWERYSDPELITDLSLFYQKLLSAHRLELLGDADVVLDSVLVDTANGPCGLFLPKLLAPLCGRVELYNGELDDRFPNRPSEPNAENLQRTAAEVVKRGCELGFATDMDADRLVLILSDGSILNGDVLGILLAEDCWRRDRSSHVVATLNSSLLLKQAAERSAGSLTYTRIGPPAIIREMKQRNAAFGFEGNGKYMFSAHSLVPDAAVSVLVILRMLYDLQVPIQELVRDIPSTAYRSEKTLFPRSEADRFMSFLFSEQKRFLVEKPVRSTTLDGLKHEYADDSWLMIRPSGTENVIRIMSESLEAERTDQLIRRGLKLVESYRQTYFTTGSMPETLAGSF